MTACSSTYWRGCRCEECRAERAAYKRALRRRQRGPLFGQRVVHVERPFSFDELEAHVDRPTTLALALRFGVDRRQVYRWRSYGLTWAQADELAGRLGVHPADVWSRAWWVAAAA